MYSETMDKEATYMPLVFDGHVNRRLLEKTQLKTLSHLVG